MSEITKSIQFICDEKGLDPEVVMDAVQSALAAAYRKDFGNRQQNIIVKFDPETADIQAWDVKTVVDNIDDEKLIADQEALSIRRDEAKARGKDLSDEEIEDLAKFNPKTEMMSRDAVLIKADAKVGDVLEIVLEIPREFGRMAAQTAKQVIIQKLREAERVSVFDDLKTEEGKVIHGTVQRRDRVGNIIIDLGKITGLLPAREQVQRENYRPGLKLPFYLVSVGMGTRGPEVVLSRTDKRMVEHVFKQEIPEIQDGEVVIRGIARDPGNRSKVAVSTDDDSIDPIGSCIGQRGSRITTIINELGGEKIDIIQYSDKAVDYIKQALSPAKVSGVELDEESKGAMATVEADQFSLAIGRGGQNVTLASELTGWKIKVVENGAPKKDEEKKENDDVVESMDVVEDKDKDESKYESKDEEELKK
jgi:transcription termination/antitermination protein NusA